MVGLLLCGPPQRLSRACWTIGRRPGRWPCGQTHLGHQCWFPSSQPQPLSARSVASTSGRSRSAGEEGSRSLQPSAPSGTFSLESVQPCLWHRQGTGLPVGMPSLASSKVMDP